MKSGFQEDFNDERQRRGRGSSLRIWIVFFGLVILFAGLGSVVAGSIKGTRLDPVDNVTSSWEVSENLSKGNTYVLDIFSSYKWRDDYTAGGYTTPQPVDMVIASPYGGLTKLQAYFIAELPETGYKSTLPSLAHVEYESVDFDSLDVDESYPQVRFTTRQTGNYSARIVAETLNWTTGAPKEIIIYHVVEYQDSWMIYLQGGGLVGLLTGAVISAWGAKTAKKIRTRRERFKK
jgi:hypothetical protein